MSLINSFILKHEENISEETVLEFTNLIKAVNDGIANEVSTVITSKINYETYTYYLDKIFSRVNEMSEIKTEDLKKFFTFLYNNRLLESPKYQESIQDIDYTEVECIRPDYFSTVSKELQKNISDIIAGTTSSSDVQNDIRNKEFEKKLKKQLVKTDLKINDIKDLFTYHQNRLKTYKIIDKIYVNDKILPFLNTFEKDVENLASVIVKTKSQIALMGKAVDPIFAAAGKTLKSGKLSNESLATLRYYLFNSKITVMNSISYITAMIIEKVEAYSYLINVLMKYYDYMTEALQRDNIVYNESCNILWGANIDKDTVLQSIEEGNLNIIYRYTETVKAYITSTLLQENYPSTQSFNNYPYDSRTYLLVQNSFKEIIDGLHKFEIGTKEPNVVIDDIAASSGLTVSYGTKFAKLLESIDHYKELKAAYNLNDEYDNRANEVNIISDIMHFDENMDNIMDLIRQAYVYLDGLITDYSSNSYMLTEPEYEDITMYLKVAKNNFMSYAYEVISRLLSRFEKISTDILIRNQHDISVEHRNKLLGLVEEDTATDYSEAAFDEALKDLEDVNEKRFTELTMEYKKAKALKERGVHLVFEAEETVTAGDGNGTSAPAPKVTNTTDTDTSVNNNTNQNATTPANNTADAKKSILDRFKAFIDKILDLFRKKSSRMTAKNNKWLNANKGNILAKSSEHGTLTIADYKNLIPNDISGAISSAQGKIQGIGRENIPAEYKKRSTKSEHLLFDSIPEAINGIDTFADRIKHFYTYGAEPENKLVKYTGDDMKTKLNDMITFCLNYSTTYDDVASKLDKLKEAAFKKQLEINTSVKGNENTTTPTNAGTTENKTNECVITGVVRDYSGAILTVLEKKYLDYMKALRDFLGNDQVNGEQPDTGNGDENKAAEEETQKKTQNGQA